MDTVPAFVSDVRGEITELATTIGVSHAQLEVGIDKLQTQTANTHMVYCSNLAMLNRQVAHLRYMTGALCTLVLALAVRLAFV